MPRASLQAQNFVDALLGALTIELDRAETFKLASVASTASVASSKGALRMAMFNSISNHSGLIRTPHAATNVHRPNASQLQMPTLFN